MLTTSKEATADDSLSCSYSDVFNCVSMLAIVLFKISEKNDNHLKKKKAIHANTGNMTIDKWLYLTTIRSTLFNGFIKIEFMKNYL